MNGKILLEQNDEQSVVLKIVGLTNAERRLYRYLRQKVGMSRHDANILIFGYSEAIRAMSPTIQKMAHHIQELLPYALADAEQGVAMGPPPEGHDDECADCVWYRESVELLNRIQSGYYDA